MLIEIFVNGDWRGLEGAYRVKKLFFKRIDFSHLHPTIFRLDSWKIQLDPYLGIIGRTFNADECLVTILTDHVLPKSCVFHNSISN